MLLQYVARSGFCVRLLFTGSGLSLPYVAARPRCLYQGQLFVVTVYVPNSGDGLVRLKYRTDEWDPQLQSYVKALGKEKPVVLNGDLNVAHL